MRRVDHRHPQRSRRGTPEATVNRTKRQPLEVNDVGSLAHEAGQQRSKVERVLQPSRHLASGCWQAVSEAIEHVPNPHAARSWRHGEPRYARHQVDGVTARDERGCQRIVVRARLAARIDEEDPHRRALSIDGIGPILPA